METWNAVMMVNTNHRVKLSAITDILTLFPKIVPNTLAMSGMNNMLSNANRSCKRDVSAFRCVCILII